MAGSDIALYEADLKKIIAETYTVMREAIDPYLAESYRHLDIDFTSPLYYALKNALLANGIRIEEGGEPLIRIQ